MTSLPSYWDIKLGEGLVSLDPQSAIYKAVAAYFVAGLSENRKSNQHPLLAFDIAGIDINQNEGLFMSYQANRSFMLKQRGLETDVPCSCLDKDYPSCLSLHQQWVFHGTRETLINPICASGFNDRECSSSQHGRGTYSARFSYYPLFEPVQQCFISRQPQLK